MKILIHSNGPEARTGYGVQTALLALRLQAAGHDVAISAYYGQQCGIGMWHGIPIYPQRFEQCGNDVLHDHALHFFGGDPLGGWIIPIMDVFALPSPALVEFNVAAWTPVDHVPAPKDVVGFFARNGATPIAMSRFGEDMLRQAGLDPIYVPLSVDTKVFKPTVEHSGVTGRKLIGCDDDAFVVMMNGMNKGGMTSPDRKGFTFAFKAFAAFARNHPEAILYMHTESFGGGGVGIDLVEASVHCGVPQHQIVWANQYGYTVLGYPGEALASLYTAADVLLAPSMSEGFCVPLIEAQACGTPVIVTDFSAQPELVGAGWKIPVAAFVWDAPQHAHIVNPHAESITDALEEAFQAKASGEMDAMRDAAINMGKLYDSDYVFDTYWLPALEQLDGTTEPAADREPMGDVAVLVPALNRPGNVAPLVESFNNANDGTAHLYFVCDEDDTDQIEAVKLADAGLLISDRGSTFAQKVNSGFNQTLEPFVFLTGDDVRFHDGWLIAARELSDRFDVIGTLDNQDGNGNPRTRSGAHADHFFVRRTYIDELGGCLDGPGTVCHEGYRHFYSDVETVELAKARGVFTPCFESFVEHLHPDLGLAEVDPTYQKGWSQREHDLKRWRQRAPLVAQQITGRGKVRAA